MFFLSSFVFIYYLLFSQKTNPLQMLHFHLGWGARICSKHTQPRMSLAHLACRHHHLLKRSVRANPETRKWPLLQTLRLVNLVPPLSLLFLLHDLFTLFLLQFSSSSSSPLLHFFHFFALLFLLHQTLKLPTPVKISLAPLIAKKSSADIPRFYFPKSKTSRVVPDDAYDSRKVPYYCISVNMVSSFALFAVSLCLL